MKMSNDLKFIDLFAGMGGFRLGFQYACEALGIQSECVFSSEIKEHAKSVYMSNFDESSISGDITQIDASEIPDFDVLLAGFPCQAFSSAGKRQGFLDTRGTLFFEVERILKEKSPKAFILENVDGLVTHDKTNKNDEMGLTLKTILHSLESLGYKTHWKVLNASDFGLAQSRKRIFIVGSKTKDISLNNFEIKKSPLKTILEQDKPTLKGKLPELLLSHYSLTDLYGKSVKDKRGGSNNIHSWDIELKGAVSKEQNLLMQKIMRARRNKKWGDLKGIQWMDGMPLTFDEISTFYQHPNLHEMLVDLAQKGYLRYEHPKDIAEVYDENTGAKKSIRQYRLDLEKGYNIVAGKLSYEINKILNPNEIAPTLVATDLDRFVVPDSGGIRRLTLIEQKRLFGFPDTFNLDIKSTLAHDLLGNTVAIPVVKSVCMRVLEGIQTKEHTQYYANKGSPQLELV